MEVDESVISLLRKSKQHKSTSSRDLILSVFLLYGGVVELPFPVECQWTCVQFDLSAESFGWAILASCFFLIPIRRRTFHGKCIEPADWPL